MKQTNPGSTVLYIVALVVLAFCGVSQVEATEPCDDFGECKALIEINSTDGDIGFHFLMDGDDLVQARIRNPDREVIFFTRARRALREQFMTEIFAESAEPLCWDDPEAEEDDEIVTLEEFLERWDEGEYLFRGRDADGELARGSTELTYDLPAAPQDVDFSFGFISWAAGDDLGNCATAAELSLLVGDGVLSTHPEDVVVDHWEVVLEPDTEDGDPTGENKFTVRVPGDISPLMVTVPMDYLDSLPDDTPVKVEVGAIGGGDNATFSEEDGFCVNEVKGCEEED